MKTSFPYIFSFRTICICFNFINTQKYCQYSVKSLWIICKLNEDRAMTQIVLKLENCIINELYSILRDKLYSSNIHCQFPPYVIIYLNKNTICKRKHNKMISSEVASLEEEIQSSEIEFDTQHHLLSGKHNTNTDQIASYNVGTIEQSSRLVHQRSLADNFLACLKVVRQTNRMHKTVWQTVIYLLTRVLSFCVSLKKVNGHQ